MRHRVNSGGSWTGPPPRAEPAVFDLAKAAPSPRPITIVKAVALRPIWAAAGEVLNATNGRRVSYGPADLRHRFINLAVVVVTGTGGVIKSVSETFPAGELVFFRNLFAFVPILGCMLWQGASCCARAMSVGHLMRGLFGVPAMYSYFLSYKLLPLSDAIALGLSGPIFLTMLSIPFLGEHVGFRQWSACIVGSLASSS
ncbi:EamA family transporter [Bradyrhizobium sp. Arg68]|uniref:EamA family transporter n=1 Tax=Bradyrhizobium ivorense TaxID=2511166 RepID=UPI001E3C6000|nr:EamA family transporter [Bradyrhizobium ivorense]MCC8942269.1 EamA family transporter [Bradyrhizobium ivorense]